MTASTTPAPPRATPGILKGGLDLSSLPWWAMILIATGAFLTYLILASAPYRETFVFLSEGILVTLRITLIAYAIATFLGLVTGLARTSKNVLLYTVSTLYVETGRGIPFIVLMLYIAFVAIPGAVGLIKGIGNWGLGLGTAGPFSIFQSLAEFSIRQVNLEARAIISLAIGYGAYEAEVFRAGIQSIGKGQVEAARSLGMTYFQAMRFIILPQAIRRVLPPLGNDFISLLKDSSLATVLAVRELTQLGRLRRASTFRVFETFNVLTFLYLSMTLMLSAVVRALERRLRIEE